MCFICVFLPVRVLASCVCVVPGVFLFVRFVYCVCFVRVVRMCVCVCVFRICVLRVVCMFCACFARACVCFAFVGLRVVGAS